MSLKDKASLIFKPSRYKSGTAYSFRGSDVTVSRSSVGTRVNAEGKIEEVAANVPRLNYDPSDLTKCPTLLTEKDATNLIYQSQNLSAWSAVNCSVTANSTTSPEGIVNSFRITENSATSTQHRIVLGSIGGSSAIYTMSAYVKNVNGNRLAYIDMGPVTAHFNFLTETIYSGAGTADFENVGNGWYRIWVTSNSAVSVVSCFAGLSVNNNETYSGDGSSAIEFYGIQLEVGSHPTSLIKTTGSTVTRDDDTVTASSPITSSRGSFYINMSSMNTIGYGTSVPSVAVYKTNTTTGAIGLLDNNVTNGEMRPCARLNGTLYYYNTHFSAPNGFKMCFVWDSNDSDTKVYKNGVLFGTIGVSVTQTFDTGVDLNAGTRENFFEYEEVMIYNERLSEAEAIALTSYDDYQELVDRNELTWESPTITNNRLTALQEL